MYSYNKEKFKFSESFSFPHRARCSCCGSLVNLDAFYLYFKSAYISSKMPPKMKNFKFVQYRVTQSPISYKRKRAASNRIPIKYHKNNHIFDNGEYSKDVSGALFCQKCQKRAWGFVSSIDLNPESRHRRSRYNTRL